MIINTKVDPQLGQLFEPGCFDENIGKFIDMMIDGTDHIGRGKITAASVAEDGTHAWLTIDIPNLASDSIDIGPMVLTSEEGPGYFGYAEEGI